MPRSLRSRLVLTLVGVATAVLLAVGGVLYVTLLQLHEQANRDVLKGEVATILASLRQAPVADWPTVLQNDEQGFVDQDGFVLLATRGGAVSVIAGSPGDVVMPAFPNGAGQTATGRLTASGRAYIYIMFRRDQTAVRTTLFAVPDLAREQTFGDLGRALPAVVLVLVVVGGPAAWLLSRSVTGPIRRLATATAALPVADGRGLPPLPLEGPSEVQELIDHFNAMSRELAATRQGEEELFSNLRHDLRTPLTSIAGYAEAIADGTVTGDGAASAASVIVGESRRLEHLVAGLGVIQRLRDGEAALRPEPLDAQGGLGAAATRVQPEAAARRVSVAALPPGPSTLGSGVAPLSLTADRLAVERILQNLVANSLAATGEGGHIWLSAAPFQPAGGPPGVMLAVTDDGTGFPPGSLPRVFERFYRADPARAGGGSGLGLSIVRELARVHGGEAWAENVAPRGARVSVFLPLVPIAPRQGAAAEGRPGVEPARG